ncbi:glutamate cyclase domain-containing protein [Arthrobacter sp. 754]|uniref:glutamate cyclase domain-containing protein n=1 Tax=Arthrobacter sp. 754 TaxID=3156315 RepID=UPI003394CE23
MPELTTYEPSALSRTLSPQDRRLDRIVNVDIGGRGVEHLYEAALQTQDGWPLVGRAADLLAAVPDKSTVLMTTGSVSRAWISPTIGENDGPAGAAVIARALALGKRVTPIVLAEETLIPSLGPIFETAGLTVLPPDKAREANMGGTLLAVALVPFTTNDDEAPAAARQVLEEYEPALLFSTERVGRNRNGFYYNMRGVNFGQDRARVDHVFDLAHDLGVPTVAVGDGGNEIGMGNVSDAVAAHIPHGADGSCACGGGLGATTRVEALVTAACSNWGCYAIAAALATRLGNHRLVHTPHLEAALLRRGVDVGLINSVVGIVDAKVDNIEISTHLAVVELLSAVVMASLATT